MIPSLSACNSEETSTLDQSMQRVVALTDEGAITKYAKSELRTNDGDVHAQNMVQALQCKGSSVPLIVLTNGHQSGGFNSFFGVRGSLGVAPLWGANLVGCESTLILCQRTKRYPSEHISIKHQKFKGHIASTRIRALAHLRHTLNESWSYVSRMSAIITIHHGSGTWHNCLRHHNGWLVLASQRSSWWFAPWADKGTPTYISDVCAQV
eukprot:6469746-Amphidinium_carterae.1